MAVVPGYVEKLLACFVEQSPGEKAQPTPEIEQPLLDPLSEREIEVLRYLATGMTNPQIADELVIAVSTVHSHCKSIYSKLSVHSRWEAMQRAQELGII